MSARRPIARWGGRIAAALAVTSSVSLVVGAMRRGNPRPVATPPATSSTADAAPDLPETADQPAQPDVAHQRDEDDRPGPGPRPQPATPPHAVDPPRPVGAETPTTAGPSGGTSTAKHAFAALAVAVVSTIAAIPVAAAAGHGDAAGLGVAAAVTPEGPALSAFHAPPPLQPPEQGPRTDGPSVRMPMEEGLPRASVAVPPGSSAGSSGDANPPAEEVRRAPAPPGPAPDAQPVRITIPSIDVDATLIEVGLDQTRAVEVPADTDTVGWYTGGPRPGEVGPAMLVGHVDSHRGAAVFFRLSELAQGAVVEVRYDDGSRWRFTVSDGAAIDKDAFPVREVLANTDGPELRLVTCGGPFDAATGHYTQNIVVWAEGGTPVVPAVLP